MSAKRKMFLANAALLGVAISWGYTFVLTKDLLEEIPPFYFLGTRFLLAALLLLPFVWGSLKRTGWQVWKMGIGCGIALWAAFMLQVIGIDLTTPGKAGVITGTMVMIVPFLYFAWARIPMQPGPVLGSLCAFSGLILLSWDGGWSGINIGDVVTFVGAIFFAVHMVMVDRSYNRNVTFDALVFVMIQLLVVGIIDTGIAAFIEPFPHLGSISPYGWFAYGFDLLFGTLLAYIVQVKAQKYSPPTHVSLLLAFEPVFAFVFSWLLWGEAVSAAIITGVFLILSGVFVTEGFDMLRAKSKSPAPELKRSS
ncbi:DMT family transporter [Aneurinibacillus aneurinilyticus]|uniref:DMT family transporter n=2 Tax=Aneurinibacillus aneurinilyticus TaxID=1391 RepID=A0A848CQ97_ANEAE|nr:DMT family transporter [Aneurinibacillus aneurinilyticus]MCI1693791.1 DMT family transporter [Aneurinibacillus aneurinilyticus]MED0669547.1 DMT family transporter [Aneurinibacillus aneurinilyticus]MED0709114.1 DMT family transporter [Aneurinibacillus aneurinilyticus]MED0725508.1 DMT family transporter [Aneurinibacillus aneurinilyticus]MED0730819.1 DMT family transporter [Aneurinibacillus aneurinilyticus]